jgi:hypothetical protein
MCLAIDRLDYFLPNLDGKSTRFAKRSQNAFFQIVCKPGQDRWPRLTNEVAAIEVRKGRRVAHGQIVGTSIVQSTVDI